VNGLGQIAIAYYSTQNSATDRLLDFYEVTSADRGATFSAPIRVTDVSFDRPVTNPNFDTLVANCYMGDYNANTTPMAGTPDVSFYLAWGDNRLGAIANANEPDPDVRFAKDVVSCPTQVTLPAAEPTSGHFNDRVTFTARLTSACTGMGVSGATLTFKLDGQPGVSATTDAAGNASATITPTEAAGTYTLTVSFGGASLLLPSSASANFTVTLEDTKLSSQSSLQVFVVGATATLSSTLVDAANAAEGEPSDVPIANPVPSQTGSVPINVTMTLGSGAGGQSCTAPTNASGVATCSFTVSSSVGNGFLTITDSFTDPTNHFQSATNTQKGLVAAFPDHGAFEIGDVTEDSASPTGASVNWWGPQHWKQNSYSALPAGQTSEPNQMKGFIETPASFPPTCGTAWTSDPGNSSNPPATVPAYMATIVASDVEANPDGSAITGNTVEIVVIQTNLPSDQYAPSVGDRGTGPIVAEVCPSNGTPK
jgi:hypothetical protein